MIIVAGKGNLAQAIVAHLAEKGVPHGWWKNGDEPFFSYPPHTADMADCVLHVGSEKRWPLIREHCERYRTPLIVGSTGQHHLIPNPTSFPIIDVPNFALEVVGFLHSLPAMVATLEAIGFTVTEIKESHQASKKSVPGTAKLMAVITKLDEDKIISVRDPKVQLRLGVPREHLDGHGYHWITFQRDKVTIQLKTAINGREPYGAGALHIANNVLQRYHSLLPVFYSQMSDFCNFPRINVIRPT